MKRKLLQSMLVVGIIGAASLTVYAQTGRQNSAQILSEVTGKTVESLIEEKVETGKTYGAIATENDCLETFREAKLASIQEYLNVQVENGELTEQEMQQIITNIKNQQAQCNGDGSGCYNKNAVCGMQQGNNNCQGNRGNNCQGKKLYCNR